MDDEIPDLEACDVQPDAPQIDRRQLPIGDPSKQFDESYLDAALKLKSEAMKAYDSDPDLALEKLTSAIEMFPTSTLFLTARAYLFFKEGDYFLALRDANLSIERGGETFKALRLKGECHEVLREFREAEACLKRALQFENDDAVVSLLQRVKRLAQEEEDAYTRFYEEKQREAAASQKNDDVKQAKGVQEQIHEEIQRKYGANPVYYSYLFKNLFGAAYNMTDERAYQLMKNEVLMYALSDDNFEKKLQEVAKNPYAAAKYANDEGFMKAFAQILGQFK